MVPHIEKLERGLIGHMSCKVGGAFEVMGEDEMRMRRGWRPGTHSWDRWGRRALESRNKSISIYRERREGAVVGQTL